jgi:hypothetical protein
MRVGRVGRWSIYRYGLARLARLAVVGWAE